MAIVALERTVKTLARKKIRDAIEKRHKPSTLFLKGVSVGLGSICFFFMVSFFAFWFLDPANFPMSSVRLMGERTYLSQTEFYQIIIPEMKMGFFQLKVSHLRAKLLALPWMKQVDVRKVWPNQLVIKFEEHKPAAYWGDKGILSTEGALFYPDLAKMNVLSLPILKGPDARFASVWQQYMAMEKMLAPLHLYITHLILAPRGAWQLRLSNGITIVLGTHDVLSRLHRFISVYEKHFQSRQEKMAYVDLRYTSGMAVGWK